MYWVMMNWGNPPTIDRAAMDGSNQTTIIRNLTDPWAITIDYTADTKRKVIGRNKVVDHLNVRNALVNCVACKAVIKPRRGSMYVTKIGIRVSREEFSVRTA
ncbi:hypothetical protein Bbelb_253330 [Branchiostoma belcheri]|nr:hypothetical protein Bbelb_253330 [Branchiostoma belcheri]